MSIRITCCHLANDVQLRSRPHFSAALVVEKGSAQESRDVVLKGPSSYRVNAAHAAQVSAEEQFLRNLFLRNLFEKVLSLLTP